MRILCCCYINRYLDSIVYVYMICILKKYLKMIFIIKF